MRLIRIPVIAISVGFMMLTVEAHTATVLKMGSHFTEDSIRGKFHLSWANEIKRQTNGELNIEIHWRNEFEGSREIIELFKAGDFQLAAFPPFFLSADDFPFYSFQKKIPMGISDSSQFAELMERLLAEVPEFDKEAERNDVKALFSNYSSPLKLVCREQISKITDMNGKVVASGGGNMAKMFSSINATPILVPLSLVYSFLSEGRIDCVTITVDFMIKLNLHDIAKHVHDITLWQGASNSIWISRDIWDGFTDEQRTIVQELSFVAERLDLDQFIAINELTIEKLKSNGVQFHDFPAEEAEKWQNSSPDFLGQFVEDMTNLGHGESAKRFVEIWKEVVND